MFGEIVSPGTRLYSADYSVKDYISRSGGLGLYADKNRLVVIHPNGDSYLWSGGLSNLFRIIKHNSRICHICSKRNW